MDDGSGQEGRIDKTKASRHFREVQLIELAGGRFCTGREMIYYCFIKLKVTTQARSPFLSPQRREGD
jgi:hypothetical protein